MAAHENSPRVDAGGDPQRRVDGVRRRAEERLDPPRLRDPCENQFDPSAAMAEPGQGHHQELVPAAQAPDAAVAAVAWEVLGELAT